MREWIETVKGARVHIIGGVSLCVREWIETWQSIDKPGELDRLPLREGVD